MTAVIDSLECKQFSQSARSESETFLRLAYQPVHLPANNLRQQTFHVSQEITFSFVVCSAKFMTLAFCLPAQDYRLFVARYVQDGNKFSFSLFFNSLRYCFKL